MYERKSGFSVWKRGIYSFSGWKAKLSKKNHFYVNKTAFTIVNKVLNQDPFLHSVKQVFQIDNDNFQSDSKSRMSIMVYYIPFALKAWVLLVDPCCWGWVVHQPTCTTSPRAFSCTGTSRRSKECHKLQSVRVNLCTIIHFSFKYIYFIWNTNSSNFLDHTN